MYLHLGQSVMIREDELIGIFDLDNTTWSFRTRRFLERAESQGRVISVVDDLPRSFVLSQREKEPSVIHITQLTTATLLRRAEEDDFE